MAINRTVKVIVGVVGGSVIGHDQVGWKAANWPSACLVDRYLQYQLRKLHMPQYRMVVVSAGMGHTVSNPSH